jgi:succinate dehydrogenase / fumarate reductase, membrane anchor subunit
MTKATSRSDKTALRDGVVSRRVREFGSARDGLREGRLQRLTAIAVIPLSLHFAASILSLATSDRKTAADWLSLPVPVLVAILVVLAGIVHALIGVRSVVRDYVHTRTRLLAAELLSSIIQPLKIKRGTARAKAVGKGSIAHRRAETAGSCCQFGWLGNGRRE